MVRSAIRNFTVISDNAQPDILNPQTAISIDAAVKRLEQILISDQGITIQQLISQLSSHSHLFDNPHRDDANSIYDIWEDIIDYLYSVYLQMQRWTTPVVVVPALPGNVVYQDLVNFLNNISEKVGYVTRALTRIEFGRSFKETVNNATTVGSLNDPTQTAYTLVASLFETILEQHNLEEVNAHVSLEPLLYSTILPTPSWHIDPMVMFDLYAKNSNAGAVVNSIRVPTYQPINNADSFLPVSNGSIGVVATNKSSETKTPIIILTSTKTTDKLILSIDEVTNNLTLDITYQNQLYTLTTLVTHEIKCVLSYSSSEVVMSTIDLVTGEIIDARQTIPNYCLNVDTIEIGMQVAYADNSIHKVAAYTQILNTDQIILFTSGLV